MEIHNILQILTLMCGSCIADKYRPAILAATKSEDQCEASCEICFPIKESLKRMGCLEKCAEEGVNHFDCPGWQSFLNDVGKPSKELQAEVEAYFAKRSDVLTTKDMEGFGAQLSENSMVIVDEQIPIIGRANRVQKLKDFIKANPGIVRRHLDPIKYGKINGIIWVNGVVTDYDSQNSPTSSERFMSMLELVDGVLQESVLALFQ